MNRDVFLCDWIRTPIGKFGGALASVRADDLAAIPIRELLRRNPAVDASQVDDVLLGCANQAGEDNRNVARMASLLAGLPFTVPGMTINRLCGSGMDAVGTAARAIASGEADLMIAGGVESMTRAPFVLGKSETPFQRVAQLQDTTMGWRFINQTMKAEYGVDTMPDTAENVAQEYGVGREDQDAFALRSQQRAQAALKSGYFSEEIVTVTVTVGKGSTTVSADEHPRADSTLASLTALKPIRAGGSVTAGNASGINDGAAALLLASGEVAKKLGLQPRARILGMATAGVEPRVMGMGPVPATGKLLQLLNLRIEDFAVIELNEAFASQALACLRQLQLPDDAAHVNPNGGAIALGHPLGMSGARLTMTAAHHLQQSTTQTRPRYALAAMCIGVGQGIALALEQV